MSTTPEHLDIQTQAAAQPEMPDDVDAWEEIEPGRFMPRRVRGSYRGQALG